MPGLSESADSFADRRVLLGSHIDVTAASMPGLRGPSGRTCHVPTPTSEAGMIRV